MDSSATVLVTGASGFVGHRVYEHLSKTTTWKLIGTSRSRGPCVDIQCDLTNPDDIRCLRDLIEPTVIIHTAAISRTDACEQNRTLCHAVNVAATCNLTKIFPESRYLYFSTYAVYDTPQGRSTETSEIKPANYYIQTKLEGEACVKALDEFVILRPSVIFGFMPYEQPSRNYFMQLLENIRSGTVTRSPKDQYFNPVSVDVVTEILRRILTARLSGTFNVGSNEDISKYEFNRMVMCRFDLDERYLEGIASSSMDIRRPVMGTVSSEHLQRALGWRIPPLTCQIDELHAATAQSVEQYLARSA